METFQPPNPNCGEQSGSESCTHQLDSRSKKIEDFRHYRDESRKKLNTFGIDYIAFVLSLSDNKLQDRNSYKKYIRMDGRDKGISQGTKMFFDLTERYNKLPGNEAFDICDNFCSAFTGEDKHSKRCSECGSAKKWKSRYSYFSPEHYTRRMFDIFGLSHILKKYPLKRNKGNIRDIWDGDYVARLREQNISNWDFDQNRYVVSEDKYFSSADEILFGLVIDKIQIWREQPDWHHYVITLINYNLPPEIRLNEENIHVLGIFPCGLRRQERKNDYQQNIESFIRPMVEDFSRLSQTGFEFIDSVTNKKRRIRMHLGTISGDITVVNKFLNFGLKLSDYPCPRCLIKKVTRKVDDKVVSEGVPTYISQESDSNRVPSVRYRDFEWIKEVHLKCTQAKTEEERKNVLSENGMNGISLFFKLGSFSVMESVPFELKHLILDDLFLELLKLLYNSDYRLKDPKIAITEKGRSLVSRLIEKLSYDVGAQRSEAGIDMVGYSCYDYDQKIRILQLFPIILEIVSIDKDLKKLLLEFSLLLLLLQSSLFKRSLVSSIKQSCQNMVKAFETFVKDNGKDDLMGITVSLHSLIHVADDIINVGPGSQLWPYSMTRPSENIKAKKDSPPSYHTKFIRDSIALKNVVFELLTVPDPLKQFGLKLEKGELVPQYQIEGLKEGLQLTEEEFKTLRYKQKMIFQSQGNILGPSQKLTNSWKRTICRAFVDGKFQYCSLKIFFGFKKNDIYNYFACVRPITNLQPLSHLFDNLTIGSSQEMIYGYYFTGGLKLGASVIIPYKNIISQQSIFASPQEEALRKGKNDSTRSYLLDRHNPIFFETDKGEKIPFAMYTWEQAYLPYLKKILSPKTK